MTDINRTACTFSRPALNANTLKLIAVLAMVLDHAATVFLADTTPAALFFHAVGQIAAPIMCFFVAEGYAYTSNLKKYLLRRSSPMCRMRCALNSRFGSSGT